MLRLWFFDTNATSGFKLLWLIDRYHDGMCLLGVFEHGLIIMVWLRLSWIQERLFQLFTEYVISLAFDHPFRVRWVIWLVCPAQG